MNITIIRHAKVKYKKKFWCTSQEFNEICSNYNISPIDNSNKYNIKTDKPIYVSGLQRTYDTAKLIFCKNNFIKMDELNEVPISAFISKSIKLPIILWWVLGRFQWFINSKQQPETRNDTCKRVKKVIDFLEKQNQDCFVVCHACYMKVLLKELKHRGYIGNCLTMNIKNLQKFSLNKCII